MEEAIYNSRTKALSRSHEAPLPHNTALGAASGGGGIFARGQALTIEEHLPVADNASNYLGGGLHLLMNGGTAVLDRVTLTGNNAIQGAGLYASMGTITLTNVTVSEATSAVITTAGIRVESADAALFVQHSTIAGNARTNTGGAGSNGVVATNGATVSLLNTILADNQENNCAAFSPPPLWGTTCPTTPPASLRRPATNRVSDPLLHPAGRQRRLRRDGRCRVPAAPPSSMGDNAECPATDARGVARPYDGDGDTVATCDIGAVETRNQFNIADTTVIREMPLRSPRGSRSHWRPQAPRPSRCTYATVDGTATGGGGLHARLGHPHLRPRRHPGSSIRSPCSETPTMRSTKRLTCSSVMPVEADLFDGVAACTIVDNDGLPTLGHRRRNPGWRATPHHT